MALKVAIPFKSQATLMSKDSKQMLKDAGFDLVCNESGKSLSFDVQKAMIQDAFAIIAGTEKYDSRMLKDCNQLKVIMRFGVGVDNFDIPTLRKMGVQIGVTENYNAVAEFTLTLILSAMKNLPRYDEAARKAEWVRYPMYELSQKTVGIIGFGRIGRRLNELFSGFQVKVLVYDPYISHEIAKENNVELVNLEELLDRSDVVSLHLPYTPENYHMIDSENIAKMKDGAYLVNTSRGSLVDENALAQALNNGKLRGAAIDVYENEPLQSKNPLLGIDNAVLTPHVSALTYEANFNSGFICAKSIINVLNGGKPINALE